MRQKMTRLSIFLALVSVIVVGCEGQQTGTTPAIRQEEKAAAPVAAKPVAEKETEPAEAAPTQKPPAEAKKKSESLQPEAADVLARKGDKRGLLALVDGALSKDAATCENCISTLHALSSDIGAGKSPKIKLSTADVAPLLKLLDSNDELERGMVIRLLGATGGKSAALALFARLPKEQDVKNKRRICTSLAQLRYRPAAAEMLKLLEEGLGTDEKDYNWALAASWAEISDPATVPAMIALLGNKNRASYAAYGLSRAFGPGEANLVPLTGPTELMVPDAAGKLEKKSVQAAPKGDEMKKLWDSFWAKNKARYSWSEKKPSLRN